MPRTGDTRTNPNTGETERFLYRRGESEFWELVPEVEPSEAGAVAGERHARSNTQNAMITYGSSKYWATFHTASSLMTGER